MTPQPSGEVTQLLSDARQGTPGAHDQLFSIVYHSAAKPGFSSLDLDEVLSQSRVKNRVNRVTGMLLAENGRFLQALEGPEATESGMLEFAMSDPDGALVRVGRLLRP